MLEKRQLRALTGSLGAGDGAGAGCGTAGFGIGITEVARVYNLATYLPEMRNAIEEKPFLRKILAR
jgi:hypothetical protein